MRTLYRAIASICRSDQPEVVVFFEVGVLCTSPSAELANLLAQVWGVPEAQLEIYNVNAERELLGNHSFAPECTGDARLLETGSGGDDPIHYAPPEKTLLLVRPATLARLRAAQQLAAHLTEYHRTKAGRAMLQAHWDAMRLTFDQARAA